MLKSPNEHRTLTGAASTWDLQIARSHVVLGDERLLSVDNLVDTKIGVEVCLNVAEDNEGAVCASTAR